MRKTLESFDVNLREEPSWNDVCYRTVTDRDTGDVLGRERYVRGMPLSVAESTLICPRNITTSLRFRLRGHDKYKVERGTSIELRGIDGLPPS